MSQDQKQTAQDQMDRDYRYAREAMQWYGWGSPIGLLGSVSMLLVAIGLLLWLLHLAAIIK